jgi:hypothetical protein
MRQNSVAVLSVRTLLSVRSLARAAAEFFASWRKI